MKTTILKSAFILALFSGTFTSCVKDDNYDIPYLGCTETSLVKNKEVSQIPFSATLTQYATDDIIEAYVTSSDEGGNFYKSISFQTLDGSIGFSVPVDVTSTFTNFEPGRKVLIKLKDLYTQVPTFGATGKQIGDIYNGGSSPAVGRLTEAKYRRVLNRSCTVVSEEDLVKQVTINQAKSDAYLNVLIELNGVQFSDGAITTTYYDPTNVIGGATNHSVIDLEGNSMIFRTSEFSNYAGKPVATGSGTLRGIMTKYNGDYQFVIRRENDIKFTETRFTPLLNEGFDNATTFNTKWTKFSVTGAQEWTYSSTYGNPGGMVKMSGYAGSNNANEDWLISPKQDLSTITTGANLTFNNAYKFTGNPIKAYMSNNYSGTGSPYASGVTWTELTGFNLSAGNYAWANSGIINITGFTGTGNSGVYVGFKYTSTSSEGSTWEIDNVKITKI
ncbi:MAG: hypothetical protein ACI924_000304 [Flavobacterium sp.]|jgi:hypothetical protein